MFEDKDKYRERPKTANPRPLTSPYTYNTPTYSLIPEAVPIAKQIQQGKIGSSKTRSKHHKHQSAAALLRHSCHLSNGGNKADMFSSSGGAFGKITTEVPRINPSQILNQIIQETIPGEHTEGWVNDLDSKKEITEVRSSIKTVLAEKQRLSMSLRNKTRTPSPSYRSISRSPSPTQVDKFIDFTDSSRF